MFSPCIVAELITSKFIISESHRSNWEYCTTLYYTSLHSWTKVPPNTKLDIFPRPLNIKWNWFWYDNDGDSCQRDNVYDSALFCPSPSPSTRGESVWSTKEKEMMTELVGDMSVPSVYVSVHAPPPSSKKEEKEMIITTISLFLLDTSHSLLYLVSLCSFSSSFHYV